MKYYIPIQIQNLEIIQQKVLDLLPEKYLEMSDLIYLESIKEGPEKFKNISELHQVLKTLGWESHVISVGFMIAQTTVAEPKCHIDTGDSEFSFNIPILNCKNTHVDFYTSDKPSTKKVLPHGTTYNHFNLTDCVLVDKLEMTIPHLIKVKEIHSVTNLNSGPRVTMLLRLSPKLNLDQLFL